MHMYVYALTSNIVDIQEKEDPKADRIAGVRVLCDSVLCEIGDRL